MSGTDVEPSQLSLALIQLMKGPVYRDTHERLWGHLLEVRHQVSDYVAVLGLHAVIDESEGYAYLRSRPVDDDPEYPRLVARRALSFHVSVLLALLRKRLAEFDATSAETRLIISRDQMVEMLRLFMPDSSNDARLVDAIDAHINKVVDLGFLRRLRDERDLFEVRRILKAYVDGQWLSEFDARLDDYLAELDHNEGAD
ncbi:MAG: DUF4194 domain-containing protein [Acidimicrobiaceae bacterium]|nr:DUF4194 domain-containing protein [Acidimicrobiaceae bacterium]